MLESIVRHCRHYSRHAVVPVMMLVISVNPSPDPTRRGSGYGGVLPVPSTPAPAAPTHVDPLLAQQRRDMRAARGRVLYTPGRGPEPERAKTAARTPCPDQRVGQARTPVPSPSS